MVTVDTVDGSTLDKYKFYFSFKEESEKGTKYVEVITREKLRMWIWPPVLLYLTAWAS